MREYDTSITVRLKSKEKDQLLKYSETNKTSLTETVRKALVALGVI
jgi:hypothetical protein